MKKNETFRFKKFEVIHEVNAQKVSTDSVLLGAWADLEQSETILDIGTGCGVLALMAAQRNSQAEIIAIEIEHSFAEEARINFGNSRFASRIVLLKEDVRKYSGKKFNHIICNPPYFSDSLKSDVDSRNKARHDLNLSFGSLAESAAGLLDSDGRISLVIPFARKEEMIRSFALFELYLSRCCDLRHNENSLPSLSMLEFRPEKTDMISQTELAIRKDGIFSEDYQELLNDFLLIF